MTCCYICKNPRIEKHEIFGGSFRQSSKNYGLVVALCHVHHAEAHEHGSLDEYLKQEGQKVFEKEYNHGMFMNIFKINYL